MKKIAKYISVLNILLYTNIVHADLPLTVADILTDKKRFKLDTELSYHNHQKTSATAQGFDTVDLGNGRTIYLPTIYQTSPKVTPILTVSSQI